MFGEIDVSLSSREESGEDNDWQVYLASFVLALPSGNDLEGNQASNILKDKFNHTRNPVE